MKKVTVHATPDGKDLFYKIGSDEKLIPAEGVLHLRGFSLDGMVGMSPLLAAACGGSGGGGTGGAASTGGGKPVRGGTIRAGFVGGGTAETLNPYAGVTPID